MKRPVEGVDCEEESEECSANLRGACDCKICLELIIRNANTLLEKGWHVNFCDNGAGGYGFDVNSSREMLRKVVRDEINTADTIVISELSDDEIERMCQEVVPYAWTGHCSHDDLVRDWRPFFHLLTGKQKKLKI
jgi:hypothetical protein